jgi:hypothetical protein
MFKPSRTLGRHFDWEKPWRRSKYLEYVQDMDPCEVPNNGYLAPNPEHLILEVSIFIPLIGPICLNHLISSVMHQLLFGKNASLD